jgi:hypothetical protein
MVEVNKKIYLNDDYSVNNDLLTGIRQILKSIFSELNGGKSCI